MIFREPSGLLKRNMSIENTKPVVPSVQTGDIGGALYFVIGILGAPGEVVATSESAPAAGESSTDAVDDGRVVDAPATPEQASVQEAPGSGAANPDEADRVRRHSSPVVRKMAAESNIDLSKV